MTAAPLLIEGGLVRTLDPACPEAAWVLVDGGLIRRVGVGQPVVTGSVRRFALRGRTLTPGFCDAHVHLTWLATTHLGPDVSEAGSLDELLAIVRGWRGPGRGPGVQWIVAAGFDESIWTEKRLPEKSDLDRIESRRPVLVKRVCGHVGVVNTAGLALLPPGPHTEAATGRIAESDLGALNDRLRPDPEALAQVVPQVVQTLHAHGVTAVHDVISPEMLRALQIQRDRAGLGLRISCALPSSTLEALRACGVQRGLGDAELRILGIKIFVDGSLGAHTAWLRDPYADDPSTRGVPLVGAEELAAMAAAADAAGLQLMVHAIGDAAIDRAIDALQPHARAGNPLRHRLEHIEVTPPDLVQRLAASGLWACVQPNFAGRWSRPGGMNEQRLGRRLAHCNAYASLMRAGMPLGFGSDCMPLGPLAGLRAAVEHPIAAERLEPSQALDLYTAGAASLVHAEEHHGRIRPGLAADLVVLSHDPLDPRGLAAAQVEATFVAGDLVHALPVEDAPGAAASA